MLVNSTDILGLNIITATPNRDERGYFVREFCRQELSIIRPDLVIEQINHSLTRQKGTVRGLHFQYPPHAELKIIRCTKGGIFDVAVDLRKDSPTFLKWHGEILTAENMKMLAVPEGFAHGFQALEDDVEMFYYNTQPYCKEAEGAIRYDEPLAAVKWPLAVTVVSQKDGATPYINEKFKGIEL